MKKKIVLLVRFIIGIQSIVLQDCSTLKKKNKVCTKINEMKLD